MNDPFRETAIERHGVSRSRGRWRRLLLAAYWLCAMSMQVSGDDQQRVVVAFSARFDLGQQAAPYGRLVTIWKGERAFCVRRMAAVVADREIVQGLTGEGWTGFFHVSLEPFRGVIDRGVMVLGKTYILWMKNDQVYDCNAIRGFTFRRVTKVDELVRVLGLAADADRPSAAPGGRISYGTAGPLFDPAEQHVGGGPGPASRGGSQTGAHRGPGDRRRH